MTDFELKNYHQVHKKSIKSLVYRSVYMHFLMTFLKYLFYIYTSYYIFFPSIHYFSQQSRHTIYIFNEIVNNNILYSMKKYFQGLDILLMNYYK